jgi:hypothetical protein
MSGQRCSLYLVQRNGFTRSQLGAGARDEFQKLWMRAQHEGLPVNTPQGNYRRDWLISLGQHHERLLHSTHETSNKTNAAPVPH